ncbi:MAG: porin family protein [Odoribacteraceae bacterium]|jgi:hypothetical protein|nr:porin family protein [Odoribacteraceae bacterium]
MKKVVFLTLFTLAGMSLTAQNSSKSVFEIGPHGGWSNTKIYVDKFHTRTHWGYFAGIFGRVYFDKGLYLEPAIDYVHKEVVIERAVNDTKLRNSSVDIPVLVGMKFLDFPLVGVRGYVGPVASFLLKPIEIDLRHKNDDPSRIVTSDKTMFYLRAGLGADIWLASLDINYEFGLKKFGPEMSIPQTMNITLGFRVFSKNRP